MKASLLDYKCVKKRVSLRVYAKRNVIPHPHLNLRVNLVFLELCF